jgi:hypothetical protein
MYFVPPTAGERFYLRTLLTVVKGAVSYEDLRTYNGTVYHNFEESCRAQGLLEDDGEWRICLEEAAEMQTGTRLRHLFATLLLFCEPSGPAQLWADFRTQICEDLRPRIREFGIQTNNEVDEMEQICDYGLYLLDQILQRSGHSLREWQSMPQWNGNWTNQAGNPLIAEQLAYNVHYEDNQARNAEENFNADQQTAYARIVGSLEEESGNLFFLHGPAGTGKTYVYNGLCHYVRAKALVILCVASSGIASLLIEGGQTAHSMFKIPVNNLNEDSSCAIPKNSYRADLIRQTKLIIWDEMGPQHRYCAEALDRTCRDIWNSEQLFGGITVVFGGDFQQTLPVVKRGSRDQIVDATIQSSYLWDSIQVLHLTKNMHLLGGPDLPNPDDVAFADLLLQIGHGARINDDIGDIPIPPEIVTHQLNNLIRFIYAGVDTTQPPPPEYFLHRSILAPRNEDVAKTNDAVLAMMAGEPTTYFSADHVIEETGADGPDADRDDDMVPVPEEFLWSLNLSGLPPGELTLKTGCPIILLRNLSPSQGLCNGTCMVIQRMTQRVLEVKILGGNHDNEVAFIPRVKLIPSDTGDYTFQFCRRQFPIRLAFAMTINKAQGQSLRFVGLDLRVPCFGHGQLYVALSRATSYSRVKVLLAPGLSMTTNVVYKDVILDPI